MTVSTEVLRGLYRSWSMFEKVSKLLPSSLNTTSSLFRSLTCPGDEIPDDQSGWVIRVPHEGSDQTTGRGPVGWWTGYRNLGPRTGRGGGREKDGQLPVCVTDGVRATVREEGTIVQVQEPGLSRGSLLLVNVNVCPVNSSPHF